MQGSVTTYRIEQSTVSPTSPDNGQVLLVVFLALDGLADLNAVRNIAKRVCYKAPIPRKTPSFILTINGVKPITALAST